MFDGGHGRFEFLVAEALIRNPEMLHQETKWNLFGDLERAFILSIASIRLARSMEAMLTGGAPARPHS